MLLTVIIRPPTFSIGNKVKNGFLTIIVNKAIFELIFIEILEIWVIWGLIQFLNKINNTVEI